MVGKLLVRSERYLLARVYFGASSMMMRHSLWMKRVRRRCQGSRSHLLLMRACCRGAVPLLMATLPEILAGRGLLRCLLHLTILLHTARHSAIHRRSRSTKRNRASCAWLTENCRNHGVTVLNRHGLYHADIPPGRAIRGVTPVCDHVRVCNGSRTS